MNRTADRNTEINPKISTEINTEINAEINTDIHVNRNAEMHTDIIAVTNRLLCQRPFTEQIERVCRFRPKALILREKELSENEYELLARKILELCSASQVPCILHSFPEAARRLGCSRIHLPLPLLREFSSDLGDFTLVGASVHSAAEAEEAEKLGADYLTAGHIYATDCKKGLPPRGLPFLREVCGRVSIPVYAIGGIHLKPEQLAEVTQNGAAGACIMSEMMRL